MEPPKGFMASLWNFIKFLPFFAGLLLLGTIKGAIFCPLICLIMTIGHTFVILVLWPLHVFWSYYSIVRAKKLGPVLKLFLCICLPAPLILWPAVGIAASIIVGVLYGFLSPIFATFDAVSEGKPNELYHCFYDGTWDTVKRSCTIVRDFKDVCYFTYFSFMDDLQKEPTDETYYEIRVLYLPGAVIAGLLGFVVDFPIISLIAVCKSPYMLFKGWHRLFHDLIGREGPFLETICVPFAGLAILLWPSAVAGAVLASMICSIFLGAYAGVVAYQESSFWYGLCFVVASLSIYDEYSNDILDMCEGSCFPRPKYRKKHELTRTTSHGAISLRSGSFKNPFSRTSSFNDPMVDLKPLEALNNLFEDCRRSGEIFVMEGLITEQDIEDAKSKKGNTVIGIGLPAYCLFQGLLRSAKANCAGLLLSDNFTEISTTNRPKGAFYDWFFNPFLIMRDQIKAAKLSEAEEGYLGKLILFNTDPVRLRNSNLGRPPESERRRAELDGIARRLHGLMKSVSRYPTSRRQFQNLVNTISEDLAKKNGESKLNKVPRTTPRSKSAYARVFSSQKSYKDKSGSSSSSTGQASELNAVRNMEIV